MSTDLSDHIEELARDLGVIVIPDWAGSISGEGLRGGAGELRLEDGERQPVIWVSASPDSAEPYLLALHELGHHRMGAPLEQPLWEEQAAWFFAAKHSLIPITPRLRAFIERRLDSYRD